MFQKFKKYDKKVLQLRCERSTIKKSSEKGTARAVKVKGYE